MQNNQFHVKCRIALAEREDSRQNPQKSPGREAGNADGSGTGQCADTPGRTSVRISFINKKRSAGKYGTDARRNWKNYFKSRGNKAEDPAVIISTGTETEELQSLSRASIPGTETTKNLVFQPSRQRENAASHRNGFQKGYKQEKFYRKNMKKLLHFPVRRDTL